jgi:hypothetical protein
MHSFSRLAAILLAAASVRADFILSSYNVLAPDSSEVRRLYGASTFSNPASRTKLQVLEKGVLRFEVDTIRSEATGKHTANAGLLQPLQRDWSPLRLNTVRAISFQIRLDRRPTEGLEVSLGSDLVSKEHRDAGHSYGVFLGKTDLPAPSVWATVTLELENFTPPEWWKPTEGFPSRDTALTAVRFLQFAPKTAYAGDGVGPTLPEIVVELRNITLVFDGGGGYPIFPPRLEGCFDGEDVLIDDFSDGDRTNELGGSWYAYSDTSTLPSRIADSARGTSRVQTKVQPGNEVVGDLGYVQLEAGLNKRAGSSGDWRPYAGWAAITTDFGEGRLLDATKDRTFPEESRLKAFSFHLRLVKAGPQISGIRFKVGLEGTPAEGSHLFMVNSTYLDPKSPSYLARICVWVEDLRQPYWVANPVPFSPKAIRSLTWEARIDDEIDSTIVQDTVAFLVSNVRIHLAPALSARRDTSRASFAASYRDGILHLDSRADLDQIRIVSSSGRIVASVPSGATRLATSLDRGTWFVIARTRTGETLSRKLVVLD